MSQRPLSPRMLELLAQLDRYPLGTWVPMPAFNEFCDPTLDALRSRGFVCRDTHALPGPEDDVIDQAGQYLGLTARGKRALDSAPPQAGDNK